LAIYIAVSEVFSVPILKKSVILVI